MIEISNKHEFELSDVALEAASGGSIGETVSNNPSPPPKMSEERLTTDGGERTGRTSIGKM